MILGIDVGGTHTDAVLLQGAILIDKIKVPTDPDRVSTSLYEAASSLMRGRKPDALQRVVMSTTLATNAIIQGKVPRVGLLAMPGPGLTPALLPCRENLTVVSGYINHRGQEMQPLNREEVLASFREFQADAIIDIGIAGKFSPRNATQEMQAAAWAEGPFRHISLGHTFSGQLNFRRRIATTALNASVWDLHRRFVEEVEKFARDMGITAPLYILKADGGTMALSASSGCPVQTILSGPAAGVMGILSLTRPAEDALTLDIGGTTTDMALLSGGIPLLEPQGVTLGGNRTLVRGLATSSVGLGGDSVVRILGREICIGPERRGPAAALGGPAATPTDAMILLGKVDMGSREAAAEAYRPLAAQWGISVADMARRVCDALADRIAAAARAFLDEANSRPVYTIAELLADRALRPRSLLLAGGPAPILAQPLGERLGYRAVLPDHADVANAVGAALARTTTELTLLADTEQEQFILAEEGVTLPISRRFNREEALRIGRERLRERALRLGADERDMDIDITEDQQFTMVRGFAATGRNIRLKLQVRPGLIASLAGGPAV